MATDAQVQRANQSLDEEIAILKAQVAAARRRRPRAVDSNTPPTHPAGAPPAPAPESNSGSTPMPSEHASGSGSKASKQQLTEHRLNLTADHIKMVTQWLRDDEAFLPALSQALGYSRLKNLLLNILLSTVFLIAGWLLSITATPTNIADLFQR